MLKEKKPSLRLTSLIPLAVFPIAGLLAQDLTGTWQGSVTNPDTKDVLRTVLKIASSGGDPVPAEGGPIKANFYSIDQTYLVFPATLTRQGSVIKMSIPGIAATWEGKLSADGTALNGIVKGFSRPVAWNMKRVTPEEAWAIPKPPAQAKLNSADPAFEVATIKPGDPDNPGRGTRLQGLDFSAQNVTLMDLLTFVYDLHPHQVVGAPSWVTSDKYDVTAKADGQGQPNTEQMKFMIGKLLAERFQLVSHKDQRDLPVFTLNVAKGGAKISRNDGKNDTNGMTFRGPGSVLFNNVAMDDFCKMLQQVALDRPVVNQTGLSGTYTFSLVWTPETALNAAPNTNALAAPDLAAPPPDVYTAAQQQLGLKIEPTRLRIDVLVLDKVEKPSAN